MSQDEQSVQDKKNIDERLDILRSEIKPSMHFKAKTKEMLFQKMHVTQQKNTFLRSLLDFILKKGPSIAVSFIFIISTFSFYITFNIQASQAAYIGELNVTRGKAYIVRDKERREVSTFEKVLVGDMIEVEGESEAAIHFVDSTKTDLSENTQVRIKHFENKDETGARPHKKQLVLHKGEIKEEVESLEDTTPLLTEIETPSGVVKAKENSSFIVSLDEEKGTTSIIVTENEVEVTSMEESSGSEESTIDSPLLVESVRTVVKGEAMTLLLAGLEPEEKYDQLAMQAVNTQPVPALSLPTSKIDVQLTQAIHSVENSSEIAKVKLYTVLEFIDSGDEKAALSAMQGYYDTLERIQDGMTTIKSGESTVSIASQGSTVQDSIASSPLSGMTLRYAGQEDMIDQALLADYEVSKKKLNQLQKLEAEILLKLKLRQKRNEEIRATRFDPLKTRMEKLQDLKEEATFENKSDIEEMINDEIESKVETILSIEDGEKRNLHFAEYLNTIPNDQGNYKILEDMYEEVPDELKGYLKVKMHEVKYTPTQE